MHVVQLRQTEPGEDTVLIGQNQETKHEGESEHDCNHSTCRYDESTKGSSDKTERNAQNEHDEPWKQRKREFSGIVKINRTS